MSRVEREPHADARAFDGPSKLPHAFQRDERARTERKALNNHSIRGRRGALSKFDVEKSAAWAQCSAASEGKVEAG